MFDTDPSGCESGRSGAAWWQTRRALAKETTGARSRRESRSRDEALSGTTRDCSRDRRLTRQGVQSDRLRTLRGGELEAGLFDREHTLDGSRACSSAPSWRVMRRCRTAPYSSSPSTTNETAKLAAYQSDSRTRIFLKSILKVTYLPALRNPLLARCESASGRSQHRSSGGGSSRTPRPGSTRRHSRDPRGGSGSFRA